MSCTLALLLSCTVGPTLVACGGTGPLATDNTAPPSSSTDPGSSGQPPRSSTPTQPTPPSQSTPPGTSSGTCDKQPPAKLAYKLTIQHGGRSRTALIHVPPGYTGKTAVPLAFNNHGSMCTADFQRRMSHLDEWADKRGVITVTPQGTGGLIPGWNVGNSPQAYIYDKVDDVGFFKALIARLEQDLCIDDRRIYCAGFSLGGSMCYRLSCDMADKIAAIASVSGPDGTKTCTPSRAVPLLHIHGTSDGFASYKADYSDKSCPNHGAEGCVMRHAKRTGCSPTTKVTFTKGKVSCKTYQGCPQNGEATLCTVTGGGHTWPGGEGWILGGPVNKDIVASRMILDFFSKYRLP
jgi:polyhydroxybutyrate depolymerase